MKEELVILKAMSDKTRLNIIEFLLDGERCVCEIIPSTKRKQSTVSIQLGKLEDWKILESRRDGKKILYRISNHKVFDVLKALGYAKGKNLKKSCCAGGKE